MSTPAYPANWLASANKIISTARDAFLLRSIEDALSKTTSLADKCFKFITLEASALHPWTADATPVELYERLEQTFGSAHKLVSGLWQTLLDPLAMAEHRLRDQRVPSEAGTPLLVRGTTLASIEAEAYNDLGRYRKQGNAIFQPLEPQPCDTIYRLHTIWLLYEHRDKHDLIDEHHLWYALAHPFSDTALAKYLKGHHKTLETLLNSPSRDTDNFLSAAVARVQDAQ